jgi:hypothetical protein
MKAKCKVYGCEKKEVVHGFCGAHHMKFRRYGDPLYVHPSRLTKPFAGKEFGKLTVVRFVEKRKESKGHSFWWLCRCGCGVEGVYRQQKLLAGSSWRCHKCSDRRGIATKKWIGKEFGRLTIISQVDTSKKPGQMGTRWRCKCKCGNEVEVFLKNLKNENTTSCGCFHSEQASIRIKARKRKPEEIILRNMFGAYRDGAKKRGFEFTITLEQFMDIAVMPCHYCGIEKGHVYATGTSIRPNRATFHGNGLDRFDNKIGYILENCVACCRMCNRMKFSFTEENFVSQCRRIAAHNQEIKFAPFTFIA